jgi:transposase
VRDALSSNRARQFQAVVASCLAHSRPRFVDVAGRSPQECRHVLETLRDVYRNDAIARDQSISAAERFAFHQEQTGPLLNGLETWLRQRSGTRLALGSARIVFSRPASRKRQRKCRPAPGRSSLT